jgi:tRNA A-37 threonylcarbamoyl transferase component Bud32
MTRLAGRTALSARLSGPPREAAERPRAAGAAPLPLFRRPGWTWSNFGEIGWWVVPEWRERLLGPSGLRLDEWRADGRLRTIKTGPNRVVYRVELPGSAVYVKHYKVPSWREVLRQWFRRGKGRNEAKRAIQLAQVGIATITPVALGEQRKRRFLFENYLVSPEIPGTVPLDVMVEQILPGMPEARRARLRRALAVEVGRLTARLHSAGFLHQDFHPGNLLVRVADEDRVALAMIDTDALRQRRRLGHHDAQANLALLNHYFWCRCTRTDRHRFLSAYLEALRPVGLDAARFARAIERSTRAWAERLWTRWGRRCRGTNKYFHALREGESRAVASRRVSPEVVRALLSDPDAPLRAPHAVILKDSRTTTVGQITLDVDGLPTHVIYKRFHVKKRLDPWLALIRPSRAWRAWQAAQHLTSRGVPTPANLVHIRTPNARARSRLLRRLPGTEYLATIKAEPAVTLESVARDLLPTLDPAARRRAVRRYVRALARLLRVLHDRSLSHRDLKAANILVEGDPFAEEPTLSLIDLVGVELRHPLPRRRRAQNLARLAVSLAESCQPSRSDALRFLRAYLPARRPDPRSWKSLWHAIDHVVHAKRRQNLRRGRILS